MSCDEPNGEAVKVQLPAELPVLSPPVSRILLGILVELTEIEVPDGPPKEGSDDC